MKKGEVQVLGPGQGGDGGCWKSHVGGQEGRQVHLEGGQGRSFRGYCLGGTERRARVKAVIKAVISEGY